MKDKIITYLKDFGDYQETDDIFIDELVFNIRILQQCRQEMDKGNKLDLCDNITRNQHKNSFLQRNRLLTIYSQALKDCLTLCRELALSPVSRKKLKLLLQNEPDKFGELFD